MLVDVESRNPPTNLKFCGRVPNSRGNGMDISMELFMSSQNKIKKKWGNVKCFKYKELTDTQIQTAHLTSYRERWRIVISHRFSDTKIGT